MQMKFIRTLVENWKTKREAEAAAKRELDAAFFAFVTETRPLTPKAEKHPQAALYRHTWKRAIVLADIAAESNQQADAELFKRFQELAGSGYDAVAPDGPYGKVRLALSGSARTQLHQSELARIAAKARLATGTPSRRLRGTVYLVKSGVNYKIGRTKDLNRRSKELKLLLPDPMSVEHEIQTNDPAKVVRVSR